jgi:hypothetical protein
MKNNTKQKRVRGRHELDTRYMDRKASRFHGLGTEFGRAKHRAEGPMNTITLFDMSPGELSAAKGLGPKFG